MSGWLENITKKIKDLSNSIDKYKEETIIQSLPSYTYVNRAKVLIAKGEFDVAEKILQKALELPQKDALVYKYLGAVYEKKGEIDKSVEAYQTSAELNPQDKNIWQRLGFALVSVGKYENAIKSFENSNKVQPSNSDTFTGWGMALMKQGKFAEAQAKFVDAARFNKYNFTAVFLCSIMDIKLGMYDKAEMKLSFLANVCPNANNTFEFARLKALKDDYESSIHYAKKSIDYNNKMLPSYILLGQVYTHKFDFENSQKAFSDAQKMELDSPPLYFEWGKSLEKFNRLNEAKEKYLKALEYDSESVEILSYLGLCCAEREEYSEAETILEKVLAKAPENKVAKQISAIIAYANDDLRPAMEFFRSDDENYINAYYLAKCYEKQNNDTKVKDYYESAVRINPHYIKAFEGYVRYLMAQDEWLEAQRKLRKALKYEPQNILLLNLMFYVSYVLVKDNVCEYNVKETISFANTIEEIAPELFEYPEQKLELEKLLTGFSERE